MSKLIDGGLLEALCLRAISGTDYTTSYIVEQEIYRATGINPARGNQTIRRAINRLVKNGKATIKPESLKRRGKLYAITKKGQEELAADAYVLSRISTYIIKKSTGEQA